MLVFHMNVCQMYTFLQVDNKTKITDVLTCSLEWHLSTHGEYLQEVTSMGHDHNNI